jgi:hypothetical protein
MHRSRASIAVGPRVQKLGTVSMRALAQEGARHVRRSTPGTLKFLAWSREGAGGQAGVEAALQPPRVPGLPVVRDESPFGFEGLTHAEQAFASGEELEPPDQGLCVGTVSGTTFVFESVNLAHQLFDRDANQYTPPVDLSAFYGIPPAFDPTTNRYGPFLSDPEVLLRPRHHVHLPPRHRQHRDHRHRPRAPRAHGPRPQLAPPLG